MTNLDNVLKSKDITLLTKIHKVQAILFPMVEYNCESWIIKRQSVKELMLSNCDAGEESSPLDSKEIKSVNLTGNQFSQEMNSHWKDAEVKGPVLWPPDANSQLIGKNPVAEKD